jgi:2',3'-cyclic-nucleotide 2'-phosphodiesterase (5'-nucleotidase family)
MSFDLRLNSGDIVLGADADFAIVTDGDKLVQDVIKMVVTPAGSNRFQQAIGSLINKRLVGKVLTAQNTITVLQSSVQETLLLLQKLQKQQAQTQTLSPAETLVQINSIDVQRDSVEPRQLNVVLKITAGDGNLLTESLTMTL